MKSLKNVFAALAFVIAFGAAFATTTLDSVRLKDKNNPDCPVISCVTGGSDCSEGDPATKQYFHVSDVDCQTPIDAQEP